MQDRVFAFLADPARIREVRRIDTHAASVFLEGDRALKIKRAVRFPISIIRRLRSARRPARRRLQINRPFAPQIYRRVVPITQGADGSLEYRRRGHAGRICDRDDPFRRAPDHRSSGRSRPQPISDLVDAIADAIAASHAAAPPARGKALDRIDSGDHRGQHRGVPSRRPAFPEEIDRLDAGVSSGVFRSPRSAGAARPNRDLCGGAMAICIWRTSC